MAPPERPARIPRGIAKPSWAGPTRPWWQPPWADEGASPAPAKPPSAAGQPKARFARTRGQARRVDLKKWQVQPGELEPAPRLPEDQDVGDAVPEPGDGTGVADDWDYYWPTKTSFPPRPRTRQARYSRRQRRLEVDWDHPADAIPYTYYDVHPSTWHHFKRADSPGKFINKYLNAHPYGPGGWGFPDVGEH